MGIFGKSKKGDLGGDGGGGSGNVGSYVAPSATPNSNDPPATATTSQNASKSQPTETSSPDKNTSGKKSFDTGDPDNMSNIRAKKDEETGDAAAGGGPHAQKSG